MEWIRQLKGFLGGRYCGHCGHALNPEDRSCANCGVPVADGERSNRIAFWLSTASAGVVLLVGLAKAAPVVAVVVLAATAWVLAFVLLTSSTASGKTTAQRGAVRPRSRTIPQWVKIAVATRDGGTCRRCGSAHELQYDHIRPLLARG